MIRSVPPRWDGTGRGDLRNEALSREGKTAEGSWVCDEGRQRVVTRARYADDTSRGVRRTGAVEL